MRVQYCDHYLPGNSADPSLKNFRAAIVVLRWTCYVWSGSFSSALFSVTMSCDKNHAAHFSCVTMSHDKNLAVCARLAEIALLSKGYKIPAFSILQCHASWKQNVVVVFILESTKKIARSNRPFHSRMHRLHVHCWKRIWWRGKCRQLHSFLLPSG